jgi:KaiC/GvpD/RAD55 family RecA-like ATPase
MDEFNRGMFKRNVQNESDHGLYTRDEVLGRPLPHQDKSQETKNMGRVKTGVSGLDEFIQGGFPKGSFVVVTGGAGSGKTIFACQFIAEGIKNNEKCLYITVEQLAREITDQAKQFGWDFNRWEVEKKLNILPLVENEIFETRVLEEIKTNIEKNHYDRIVIDSITSAIHAPFSAHSILDGTSRGLQPGALIELNRASVTNLIDLIKTHGITAIGISQKVEGMPGETYDTFSEFKADGLIILDSVEVGDELNRTIRVKKLRKTKISGLTNIFEFTQNGIAIKRREV